MKDITEKVGGIILSTPIENMKLWMDIMDFIHDEELHCLNFATLIEMHFEGNENSTADAIVLYLRSRAETGKMTKELIDSLILHGKRKKDDD